MYQEVFKLHTSLLKALAHPKRLEILQLLRNQELTVTEIQQMLGLGQANLSQHLQVLRQAGVVATRRAGKEIYYQISHPNFIKASDLLRKILIQKYRHTKLANEFTKKMSDLVPLVHDPVCGMRLSPATAGFALRYKNQPYYFCASGCLKEFKGASQKYAPKQ